MDCITSKAIWVKTRSSYEGDIKVKKDKIQGFRMKFESLNICDDEYIAKYFLIVDEVVNTIRGLREKLEESIVV